MPDPRLQVTNPPWGIETGKNCDLRDLYRKFLSASWNVTKSVWQLQYYFNIMIGHFARISLSLSSPPSLSAPRAVWYTLLSAKWVLIGSLQSDMMTNSRRLQGGRVVAFVLQAMMFLDIVRSFGQFKLLKILVVKTRNNLPSIFVLERLATDEAYNDLKTQLFEMGRFLGFGLNICRSYSSHPTLFPSKRLCY